MTVETTSFYDSLVSKGQTDTTKKATATKPKSGTALSSTDFLILLTQELKHQDPTAPMDNAKMVDQMTQYSQLSELTEMNKKMEAQTESIYSMASSYALDYLGKKIEAKGYTLTKSGEDISEMFITLGEKAKALIVNIYDTTGRIVDSKIYSDVDAGSIKFEWDGLDYQKKSAKNGNYYVLVEGTNADGKKISTSTTTTGTVTGVSKTDQGVYLSLADGRTINLANVTYAADAPKATQ